MTRNENENQPMTEQDRAIHTTGQSIIVSASAGAGKTRVLVKRLIKRCIDDGIPVQQILAVTFTKAAAAEMKKRFAESLHQRKDVSKDEKEIQYINEQLIALDTANITTIDAYCLTIIQKYYNVIHLDPAMTKNIISDGMKNILKREAFEHAYKDLCEKDKNLAIQIVSTFSDKAQDYDSLYKAVWAMNAIADSAMDPDKWYAHAASFYTKVTKFADFSEEIQHGFYQNLELRLLRIPPLFKKMHAFGDSDTNVDQAQLHDKEIAYANCMQAIKEKNYSTYCTSLANLALLPTAAVTKNKEYYDARTKLHDEIQTLLNDRFHEETFVRDANETSIIAIGVIDLARNSRDYFCQAKKDHACIDYTDMERYALDILEVDDGEFASLIRNSLQEIMIDEFQDTSELQNAIIEKIARTDNVFRVGDVKQSIYRFRQAKPALMRSLMKDDSYAQIRFPHNYRSKDSIVKFTNTLFDALMNIHGTKDEYLEQDHVTIGDEKKQGEKEPVPIVFAQIQAPKQDIPAPAAESGEGGNSSEAGTKEEDSPANAQLKAAWIAQKILERKAEDPNLDFRSFAVLTRSNTDKLYLRSAFDHAGIPYDIDAAEGFYNSELCQTILSMCTLMQAPNNMLALLAVVTSGFYQIDDQEIADIFSRKQDLYEGIKANHPGLDVHEEMKELAKIADKKGVLELLTEIANRHNFYEHLSESDKANFDFLFEKTNTADPRTLSEFIEIITASEDENSSEAMSVGKDDDVVTVMTIHSSKGLQFPIVFLWSSSINPFKAAQEPYILDETLGIGLPHIELPLRIKRKTVQEIAIENKANLEDIEEYIRLLYVAVTRAIAGLYIVDAFDNEFDDAVDLSMIYRRKGMSGLILPVMNAVKEKEPDYPYFTHLLVPADFSIVNAPKPKRYVVELPHYAGKAVAVPAPLTPSSTETFFLPELDLTASDRGALYGTKMHELAAALPNRTWTMEDLKDTDLTDTDKNNLLAFSASSLYQECLKGEIHKEYNFYIEKETSTTGAMDFVSIFDDHIILIDFKTNGVDMETLQQLYHRQLNLYRKSLQILYPGRSVKAFIWSFHNRDSIEIEEEKDETAI
jgi:ATP-dependent helicase/nuclease subunit A